jgi:hypothetical protein
MKSNRRLRTSTKMISNSIAITTLENDDFFYDDNNFKNYNNKVSLITTLVTTITVLL